MYKTIVMDTFDWRPPKRSLRNGKKSLDGACDWQPLWQNYSGDANEKVTELTI